jgi:hypothetical protein
VTESALSPPDLANAVTSFCTLGAGLATLTLARLVPPTQPWRWQRAYLWIFLTGIPTLGWHGWPHEIWRVFDTGTNLILAYTIQLAVLGDYYSPSTLRRVGIASGVLNAAGVLWMAMEGATGILPLPIDLGSFGGFNVGEVVLILDALLVTGLLYAKRGEIPDRARPLLRIVTALFVLGLGLASAAGTTLHAKVLSYHALWHIVGAFGFVFLWAFNHVRLSELEPTKG